MSSRRCFAALSVLIGVFGCSSEPTDPIPMNPGLSGGAGSGGANPSAGGGGATGNPSGTAGNSNGGQTMAGGGKGGAAQGGANPVGGNGGGPGGNDGGASTGGTPQGGTGGGGGAGGESGGLSADDFFGIEDGDTLPHRLLNFTFDGGQDVVSFKASDANPAAGGGQLDGETNQTVRAGVDSCAPKMLGKLVVDMGVDRGDYWRWAAQRGFHVLGVDFYHCSGIGDWDGRGPDHPGDCRLETFDGEDHTDEVAIDKDHSMMGHIENALHFLHERDPSQDWEFFLNEDGSVRWSDVALTGYSHGAQTVARVAKRFRLYRSVSRSGPRDNGCGTGAANGAFNPQSPPWNANCSAQRIGSWLDEESVTPVERIFGMIGGNDDQYGDVMFSMERMNLPGQPINLDSAQAPYNSNRFYALSHTHSESKDSAKFSDFFNHAFGVPEENRNGCN